MKIYNTKQVKLSNDGYPVTKDGLLIAVKASDYCILTEETTYQKPFKVVVVQLNQPNFQCELQLPQYTLVGCNSNNDNMVLWAKTIVKQFESVICAFNGYAGI